MNASTIAMALKLYWMAMFDKADNNAVLLFIWNRAIDQQYTMKMYLSSFILFFFHREQHRLRVFAFIDFQFVVHLVGESTFFLPLRLVFVFSAFMSGFHAYYV